MIDPAAQLIVSIIDEAPIAPIDIDAARPATQLGSSASSAEISGDREDAPNDEADETGPSDAGEEPIDPDVIASCARLDHSDTDNGKRLIAHFGDDLVVLEEEGARNTNFLAWTGTHWDMIGGNDAALRIAQKIGGRIALEADYLTETPPERAAIEDGEAAESELARFAAEKAKTGEALNDEDRRRLRGLNERIDMAKAARAALDKRKVARRKFGISSKNKSRLEAMLACAAPHLTKKPSFFNADPLKLATKSHTLRFRRALTRDLDCPDPDIERMIIAVEVDVIDGHSRADYITQLVPIAYDAQADCPKWRAFLEEFMPVQAVRDCVQVLSGLGLLGLTVQKIAFHYGLGANGKSVFLETLVRVLGPLAVGLPAESITGNTERGAGQASPDLARLFGKRFLRVLELPADKPLHEDLIKKLTGGESITVRSLFKAFWEFTPVFVGHMSGNGYPRIDGTDNGIWRRMVVIHWPVTIEEARQKNFEDVLAEFAPEYPGILNWLIEGAVIYLRDGLMLPSEVRSATQDYRDEMDTTGQFISDCVEHVPPGDDGSVNASITAREMYEAYVSWCLANAKPRMFEARFGRTMKTKFTRTNERIRRYLHCRLHDVPPRPEPSRNPDRRND